MFSKLTLCLASGLASLASGSVLTYPLHASCKLDWTFSESCSDVFTKIVDQINTWDVEICPVTAAECDKLPCGQLCLYKLTGSTEPEEITGTHATPVSKYVDSLSFSLSDNGSGCDVHAESRADTAFAWLDFGTNYCNLRNLIDGAGLSDSDGFSEETSDSVCTQYTSADCTRY